MTPNEWKNQLGRLAAPAAAQRRPQADCHRVAAALRCTAAPQRQSRDYVRASMRRIPDGVECEQHGESYVAIAAQN
jgi:hypothetical protein